MIVGSVRNQIDQVSELFNLPPYVYPIAGLSIGKPTVEMQVKPRLPEKAVIHYDTYQAYDYQLIEDYDQTMKKFGEARETKLQRTAECSFKRLFKKTTFTLKINYRPSFLSHKNPTIRRGRHAKGLFSNCRVFTFISPIVLVLRIAYEINCSKKQTLC